MFLRRMKDFRLLLLMGIALVFVGQSLCAQDRAEQKEKEAEQVKELLESGRFTIEVDRALPMQGKPVNLTTLYSLEMRGDSVVSYLPYFGRAYSLPYGGGEGLRFETLVSDYQLSYNKKGKAHIRFTARTKEDTFQFHVDVFTNGSATIGVTSTNRQEISYQGKLLLSEPEE